MRKYFIIGLLLSLGNHLTFAENSLKHQTTMWSFYHKRLLNNEPYVFDDRVQVNTPPFAEDARQVPLQIDATSLKGTVQKIILWAELNPIPQIMIVEPTPQLANLFALRIRVEQATHIRAAFLMENDVWHVGTGHIEAAGGGCTAPSVVRAQEGWESNVGKVLGARYLHNNQSHLRMRISHPMDNGLFDTVPEYFIDHAQLKDPAGRILASFQMFASISENPTLSLTLKNNVAANLWLRDNNGNEFTAQF